MPTPLVFPPDHITSTAPRWRGLPRKHKEGQIGAIFGDMAVSSPNSKLMFQPMYGHDREVALREDYGFGLDDPLFHPQAFWPELRHLASILAPNTNSENDHLFRRFRPEWAEPISNGIEGMFRFNHEQRTVFKRCGSKLLDHIESLKKDIVLGRYGRLTLADFDTPKFRRDIYNTQRAWLLLGRSATLHDLKLRYVNVQRHELILRARIDDMTIFGPRFAEPTHEPRPPSSLRVGAMTTHLADAEMLYQAGIPVWYVYHASVANRDDFETFLSPEQVKSIQDAHQEKH